MYCKYCGTEISADASFCTGCGKPVSVQPAISFSDRGLLIIGVVSFGLRVVGEIFTQLINHTQEGERLGLFRMMHFIGYLWLAIPFMLAFFTRYKPYRTILLILAVLYVLLDVYRYIVDAL